MKKSIILSLFVASLFFLACEEILLEQDISGSTVNILGPAEGAIIERTNLNFNWENVSGASYYQIQIATPNFQSPEQIIADSIVNENYHFEELLENDYEWRVKAWNSSYNTAFTTRTFTVTKEEGITHQGVRLLLPSDDLATTGDTDLTIADVSFDWERDELAVSEEVANFLNFKKSSSYRISRKRGSPK